MQNPIVIPALVQSTRALADALHFDLRLEGNAAGSSLPVPSACLDEVGSLLRTLVSTMPTGRIAEVGTGAGVGSAWIASSLHPTVSLTTVELDPVLADAVRSMFSYIDSVEVLTGDWLDVLSQRGLFDLVFFDGGDPAALHRSNWPIIAALVKRHGIMILDDLAPEEHWPANWHGQPDPKRELAFNSGLFTATEVRVRADRAILVMVRC